MLNNLNLEITITPSSEDIKVLLKGLEKYAKEIRGLTPLQPFGIFYKDDEGQVHAGCNGMIIYEVLYIDQLWVDEKLRNQKIGTFLMKKAEQFAKESSCSMVTLITMDFEALPFYKKLGYEADHSRKGFAKNSTMYFLKKNITPVL